MHHLYDRATPHPAGYREVDPARVAPLQVVCRSGARSARAAELLSSMGFRHVMNLRGSMLAWNEARLPVER